MAEQRHRTTLEYRVDDRQIRGLDETLHKAFDPTMVEAFEQGLERAVKHIEALAKAAERLDTSMRRSGMGGGGGGGPISGPRAATGGGGDSNLAGAIQSLTRGITALNSATQRAESPSFLARTLSTSIGTYLGGLAVRAGSGGEGFVAQAVGGIPFVGGILGGAVSGVQHYYAEYAAAQQAIARTVGQTGRSRLRGGRAMTAFGMSRPEAFAHMAQISGASGLTGDELTGDVIRQSTALQMLGGVTGAEQIIGAQNVAGGPMMGGGRTNAQTMMTAVSAGIQTGLRDARLGQFVSAAAQVLEQGRIEGTDLSTDTINQLTVGLARLGPGFMGERAQRAMGSAIPTLRNFTPGQDVGTAVMLRSVGFGSPGGPGYHEALRMMQDEPARVLPMILNTIRQMAPGNQEAQTELMRQLGPRFLGMTPSISQAEALSQGDLSGFNEEVGTREAGQFLARRAPLRGAFGVPAVEAAYRNRRIAVGGQVAGAAIGVRNFEMSMAETVMPRMAQGIEGIFHLVEQMVEQFRSGGLQSMFGNVVQQITQAITGQLGLPSQIADVVSSQIVQNPSGALEEAWNSIAHSTGNNFLATDNNQVPAPQPTAGGSHLGLVVGGSGIEMGVVPNNPPATAPAGGDTGPTSSAADALRRISHDAARAADALDVLGLPGEGSLGMG